MPMCHITQVTAYNLGRNPLEMQSPLPVRTCYSLWYLIQGGGALWQLSTIENEMHQIYLHSVTTIAHKQQYSYELLKAQQFQLPPNFLAGVPCLCLVSECPSSYCSQLESQDARGLLLPHPILSPPTALEGFTSPAQPETEPGLWRQEQYTQDHCVLRVMLTSWVSSDTDVAVQAVEDSTWASISNSSFHSHICSHFAGHTIVVSRTTSSHQCGGVLPHYMLTHTYFGSLAKHT
jgi:hypothetical protein